MALTSAQRKANDKYIAKAYDRFLISMKKGKKEQLQAHASERGESLNGFVNRAIDETVQRDMKGADNE